VVMADQYGAPLRHCAPPILIEIRRLFRHLLHPDRSNPRDIDGSTCDTGSSSMESHSKVQLVSNLNTCYGVLRVAQVALGGKFQ
jgi:hypothetical protein